MSNSQELVHSDVPVYGVSDHYPICMTRKVHKQKGNIKQITYRSMRNFDVNCFMSNTLSVPWHLVGYHYSPDAALATWGEVYTVVQEEL